MVNLAGLASIRLVDQHPAAAASYISGSPHLATDCDQQGNFRTLAHFVRKSGAFAPKPATTVALTATTGMNACRRAHDLTSVRHCSGYDHAHRIDDGDRSGGVLRRSSARRAQLAPRGVRPDCKLSCRPARHAAADRIIHRLAERGG